MKVATINVKAIGWKWNAILLNYYLGTKKKVIFNPFMFIVVFIIFMQFLPNNPFLMIIIKLHVLWFYMFKIFLGQGTTIFLNFDFSTSHFTTTKGVLVRQVISLDFA
jgi:hypothetical protein